MRSTAPYSSRPPATSARGTASATASWCWAWRVRGRSVRGLGISLGLPKSSRATLRDRPRRSEREAGKADAKERHRTDAHRFSRGARRVLYSTADVFFNRPREDNYPTVNLEAEFMRYSCDHLRQQEVPRNRASFRFEICCPRRMECQWLLGAI